MLHDHYLLPDSDYWFVMYVLSNDIHPEDWYGSVLYLGMGSCYNPLKQSDKVTRTTIVEIDQRTIDYNKDRDRLKPEWTVICDDAFTFEPAEKYDFIFVDIWYSRLEDHQIVDNLVKRYRKYLTKDGQVLYLKTIKR